MIYYAVLNTAFVFMHVYRAGLMKKSAFRKDINGIRAIAVIAVVMFHYNNSWISGGFAGVDVFFVISGYLMTSIIFRGLSNNNFSIFEFIKARAKRIIPALSTVVLVLLVIGYFLFEPLTYQMIGKHAASSLIFVSNYVYESESGYFDLASNSKFLLHTWSLSVEWQFYILYPIIIVILLKKYKTDVVKKIIIFTLVLSLLLSLYLADKESSSAYFSLYTRIWEMLVGGAAFLYPINIQKKHKKTLELIGLIIIVSSFFIISESTAWPGYMALYPIMGVYICIVANNQDSITSNPLIQWIGRTSYSIYLVHWPILVIFNKLDVPLSLSTYLLLVLIFSFSLYYTIERKRNYTSRFLSIYIVIFILSLIVANDGVKERVDAKYQLSASQYHKKYYGGSRILSDGSVQKFNASSNEQPEFIITGDSFARQYVNFFKKNNVNFIAILKDGCFSSETYLTSVDEMNDNICKLRFDNFKKILIESGSANVLYMQSWRDKLKLLDKNTGEIVTDNHGKILIDELDKIVNSVEFNSTKNRKLFIVGNPPGSSTLVFECKAKEQLPISKILGFTCDTLNDRPQSSINDTIKKWSLNYNNVFYIEPQDVLCTNDKCLIQTPEGEPIYSDFNHLSIFGADIVGKHILNKIKNN